nr:hypothetical protein [Luteibacter rhizovicinus]
MNPILIVILQKIAGKLLERSSVSAYVVALLATFGVKDPQVGAQIAGYLATAASVVLFVLNDATLGKWIRGKAISPQSDVVEPKPITVPEALSPTAAAAAPQEATPMSFVSIASGLLAKLQAVAALLPILTSLVQTVEATLPAGTLAPTS